MRKPRLQAVQRSRQAVTVFGGYNHNPVIGDGEWWDMNNMTSDHYPLLAPEMRGKIDYLGYGILGMVSNNGLCYVKQTFDGVSFVIRKNDSKTTLDLGLEGFGERQLIAMGAYVIILPDKKWVNTADHTYGDIEATNTALNNSVMFKVCTKDGTPISFSATEQRPTDPEDGMYWVDTTQSPPVLKQWFESSRMWMEQESYLRISISGRTDDALFQKGDAVVAPMWKGKYDAPDGHPAQYVWIQENPVIQDVINEGDGNFVYVVRGISEYGGPDSYCIASGEEYTWSRKMPDLDYVIESGNRLWGCKYGQTDDGFINEIYASKLGDFKNWTSFQGVSTDSYRASLGADGKFTGAVNYNGRPIFFKDDCMTVVYGAYPAQYQVSTIECNGVQDGCSKSLSIVNNKLYYWSRNGACLYDGSLPVTISAALGSVKADYVVSGALNNKLYMNSLDVNNNACCYVLDTMYGLWHKIEGMSPSGVCAHDGELYFWATHESDDDPPQYTTVMRNVSAPGDGSKEWFVESGDIGLTTIDASYMSQLTIRMSLAEGSQVVFKVKYDFEDEWNYLTTIIGTNLRTFDVPIRPKRCDTMRLRIEGTGDAKIYAIVKTIEQGGDVH